MNSWNGLDFFVFLILILNTVLGMARGASKEIISLMCLSAALIFSIKFTVPLSNFLNHSTTMTDLVESRIAQNFMQTIGAGQLTTDLLKQVMYSISLLICFTAIFCICEAGITLAGAVEAFSFPYAALNRKLGGVLGLTRGYIISLLALSIIVLHLNQAGNQLQGFISGSYFAELFQSQVQTFDQMISSQKPENYNKLYQNQPYKIENLHKDLPGVAIPYQQQQTQTPSQSH